MSDSWVMKSKARVVAALVSLTLAGACSGSPSATGQAGAGGQTVVGAAGNGSAPGAAGTSGPSGAAGSAAAAGTTGSAGGSAAGSGAAGTAPASPDAGTDAATTGAAGTAAPSDAGVERGGAPTPPSSCSTAPKPAAGATVIDVRAPATLAAALMTAKAGDRVVLHAGSYAKETISNRKFATPVFIEVAAGDAVTLAGATFKSCDHLSFRDVKFSATVMLDGSSNFTFHGVTLDAGATEEAALHIHGQSAAGASHDVLVEDSVIGGGGRTIFVLGSFAPSDKWNHHLTFVRDDITCGSHNCFQISGGRDLVIDGNRINGTTTAGVLTAGATRVSITRNRMKGMAGKSPCAAQIASPGMEWDNYDGVENMISSAVVIANNVIDGWGAAVQLDAARDVAIVHNTVADGTGVRFNHRVPHDRMGNVILNGNSDIRVWNDVMPSLSVATGETGPTFASNNVVWKGGGGGTGVITTAPTFTGADFALAPGNAGLDAALVNAETPLVDFENRPRGPKPDIGAHELGAPAPAACP